VEKYGEAVEQAVSVLSDASIIGKAQVGLVQKTLKFHGVLFTFLFLLQVELLAAFQGLLKLQSKDL